MQRRALRCLVIKPGIRIFQKGDQGGQCLSFVLTCGAQNNSILFLDAQKHQFDRTFGADRFVGADEFNIRTKGFGQFHKACGRTGMEALAHANNRRAFHCRSHFSKAQAASR